MSDKFFVIGQGKVTYPEIHRVVQTADYLNMQPWTAGIRDILHLIANISPQGPMDMVGLLIKSEHAGINKTIS